MRNPWLMKTAVGDKIDLIRYPTEAKALAAAHAEIDLFCCAAVEVFRLRRKGLLRHLVARFCAADGMTDLQIVRAPRKAVPPVQKQFSAVVDQALMEKGLTAREARKVRQAIVAFWREQL